MIPEHDDFHTYFLMDKAPFTIDDNNGTIIYGFYANKEQLNIAIPKEGACYGYVHRGELATDDGYDSKWIKEGYWFTTANGLRGELSKRGQLFVVQKRDYRGMDVIGKLEKTGRLNYIDGAKDSILFGPIKKGDPIINALFMPPGIHQTMHTHPSTRCGIIISGGAQAETRKSVHPLEPGMVFYLPTNGWHKFRTDVSNMSMTLVAFHPDSDFGPSDEDHPMLNRTMVGEKSAKDMPEIQTQSA